MPIALTIAGSDSGGGAGIQADLKTFAALGVHGAGAITAVTAQNPQQVLSIHATPPLILRDQIKAITAELPPEAVKTGMLFSERHIEVVAEAFRSFKKRGVPRVVDPVAVATSGAHLLQKTALDSLKTKLLPNATLVTPNLAEVELLIGMRVGSVEEMRIAARRLFDTFGCAALIKGGHLDREKQSIDIYFDGDDELLLIAARVPGVKLHGAGCTYSAAITAYLALGCSLSYSVRLAKEFISQAIVQHTTAHGHPVLNHFWT